MSELFSPNVDNVRLANATVLTAEGQQIKLGQIWQSKPVILVFLRHFACIACRTHALEVWRDRQDYLKHGNIVFIGNGDASYIEKFKTELKMREALVLTDPSLESFRAAGFHYGFFYVVQTATIKNVVKMLRKGHKQVSYTKKAGTHWQLGGVLGVNTNGEVFYQYISESMGDFPDKTNLELIKEDEKKRDSPTLS